MPKGKMESVQRMPEERLRVRPAKHIPGFAPLRRRKYVGDMSPEEAAAFIVDATSGLRKARVESITIVVYGRSTRVTG